MRAFLMAAAVLVGLANAAFYSMVGDKGPEEPFSWKLEPWPLTPCTRFRRSWRGSRYQAYS